MPDEEIVCVLHKKKHVFDPLCWKAMRHHLFRRISLESEKDQNFHRGFVKN